jgi:hypothetical protein
MGGLWSESRMGKHVTQALRCTIGRYIDTGWERYGEIGIDCSLKRYNKEYLIASFGRMNLT